MSEKLSFYIQNSLLHSKMGNVDSELNKLVQYNISSFMVKLAGICASENKDVNNIRNRDADLADITAFGFSLVFHYSLKFTRCSLLVLKSLVARC